MHEETVTLKNGNTKRVVAGSKEDLAEAVKAAKAEVESTPVDINVPLQKGHDLLAVDAALVSQPVDGTGAHNSPLPAVDPDTGNLRGSDPMYVVRSQDVAQPVVSEVTGPGETKHVNPDKLDKPDTAQKEAQKVSNQPNTATAAPNTESRGK